MSKLLNVREVAEQALRLIGAYTTAHAGPDPEEFAVAVDALDFVMGHYLSTDNFWFLVPSDISLTLTATQQDYDLATELASDWPDDGIIFPLSVVLVESGSYEPLDVIRRDQFNDLDQDETGTPSAVYFDRSDPSTITLRTWPILSDTANTYTLQLTIQKFAKQVAGVLTNPLQSTGLPSAWNLWMIHQLAAYIGSGPVRRLSSADIDGFYDRAEKLKLDLERFANKEHESSPIAEPWGM